MMPLGVPSIALRALLLKALLFDRLRHKDRPDDWDMELGEWLFKMDNSRATLDFIAYFFKGTYLEANVDLLLEEFD